MVNLKVRTIWHKFIMMILFGVRVFMHKATRKHIAVQFCAKWYFFGEWKNNEKSTSSDSCFWCDFEVFTVSLNDIWNSTRNLLPISIIWFCFRSKPVPYCSVSLCTEHSNLVNQTITFYLTQPMDSLNTGARRQQPQKCHWSLEHDTIFHFSSTNQALVDTWPAKFTRLMSKWWIFWTTSKTARGCISELCRIWIWALAKGKRRMTLWPT